MPSPSTGDRYHATATRCVRRLSMRYAERSTRFACVLSRIDNKSAVEAALKRGLKDPIGRIEY
jgi:hypothetical protein